MDDKSLNPITLDIANGISAEEMGLKTWLVAYCEKHGPVPVETLSGSAGHCILHHGTSYEQIRIALRHLPRAVQPAKEAICLIWHTMAMTDDFLPESKKWLEGPRQRSFAPLSDLSYGVLFEKQEEVYWATRVLARLYADSQLPHPTHARRRKGKALRFLGIPDVPTVSSDLLRHQAVLQGEEDLFNRLFGFMIAFGPSSGGLSNLFLNSVGRMLPQRAGHEEILLEEALKAFFEEQSLELRVRNIVRKWVGLPSESKARVI